MRHYLARSILATMTFCAPFTASAQKQCGPRREVIDTFRERFGETESWFGQVDGSGGAVVLLLTGKNGSWTLLLVRPDVACGIASGSDSTMVPPGAPA